MDSRPSREALIAAIGAVHYNDARTCFEDDRPWPCNVSLLLAALPSEPPSDRGADPLREAYLWHGDGDLCLGAECMSIDEATGDHDTDIHSNDWWDGFTEHGRRAALGEEPDGQ